MFMCSLDSALLPGFGAVTSQTTTGDMIEMEKTVSLLQGESGMTYRVVHHIKESVKLKAVGPGFN